MKTLLAFCMVLLSAMGLTAQVDTNKIFTLVMKQAKFTGGDLNKWLGDNIVYPAYDKDHNIEGTIYVSFVVERNGSISNVKILHKQGMFRDSLMEQEGVRVISSMPKWTPGEQNGHSVRQLFNVPLHFTLKNDAVQSQTEAPSPSLPDNGDGKIYKMVQVQPKFSGDISAWLAQNLVYPMKAKEDKVEGTVFVNIIIEKDGSITSPSIMRGIEGYKSMDDEAIRVVSMMPRWVPGYQNGVAVRVQYMMPVHFSLADNSSQSLITIQPTTNQSGDNNNNTTTTANLTQQPAENVDGLVIQVDEKPEFHGNLLKYLADNIRYPESVKAQKTEGTVYTSFLVTTNGKIADARIEKKGHQRAEFEEEALRVINAMPKWKPAMLNGKPVAIRLYLAIPFFLNVDEN